MLLKDIKNISFRFFNRPIKARKAYDIWAEDYDSEVDNLVLKKEDEIFSSLMKDINLNDKIILDYGCGTGRNLKRLSSFNVRKIIACDISPKMLSQLKIKFQGIETYLLDTNTFPPIKGGSIDFIISTLVAAHIKDLNKLFFEWKRILQNGAFIFISDLHPDILSNGGKRTFNKKNKVYEIKNYVHTIEEIKMLCRNSNFEVTEYSESYISPDTKSFYERNNALTIYDNFFGLPLVYGMLIRNKL